MSRRSAKSRRKKSGRNTRRNIPTSGKRSSRPKCEGKNAAGSSFRGANEAREPGTHAHRPAKAWARQVFMDPGPAPAGHPGMTIVRADDTTVAYRRSGRKIVLFLPKIVVTALLVLAIGDMLAGVFFRYIMVQITD